MDHLTSHLSLRRRRKSARYLALLVVPAALALWFRFAPLAGDSETVGLVEQTSDSVRLTRGVVEELDAEIMPAVREPVPSNGMPGVDSSMAATEPEEEADESGLTRSEKIAVLLESYARYANSLGEPPSLRNVGVQYDFARRCAITILRERNEAQYTPDIDDGEKSGFILDPPDGTFVQLAADNAKYTIFTDQFPAFTMARERYVALVQDDTAALATLTTNEQALHEQLYASALESLEISTDSAAQR